MVRCCSEGLFSASSPHQIRDKRFESLIVLFCEHEHISCHFQAVFFLLLSAARWAESMINHSSSFAALPSVWIPWGFFIYRFSQQRWWAISVFLFLGRGKGIKQHKMESSGLQKCVDSWLNWQPQLSISQWTCLRNAGISIKLLRFLYSIIIVLIRNAYWCFCFLPDGWHLLLVLAAWT